MMATKRCRKSHVLKPKLLIHSCLCVCWRRRRRRSGGGLCVAASPTAGLFFCLTGSTIPTESSEQMSLKDGVRRLMVEGGEGGGHSCVSLTVYLSKALCGFTEQQPSFRLNVSTCSQLHSPYIAYMRNENLLVSEFEGDFYSTVSTIFKVCQQAKVFSQFAITITQRIC